MVKVLFLSPPSEDYLADSVFHGLRCVLKENVVDFPYHEVMYKGRKPAESSELYGRGFTLYGLLEDIPVDRFRINEKVRDGYFNLIIVSSIFNQFGVFLQFLPFLNSRNTLVLDGEDTPQPYPYAGKWWRYPKWWFLPRAHKWFLYFKREWTPETIHNIWFKGVPKRLCKFLSAPNNFRPISFSIPEEKIVKKFTNRVKLFPKHIVDPEVAENIPESSTGYPFNSEEAYYGDLQASKFGITTKRAGWDCLRHYEIAASGAVLCFRDLHKKPETCAPHGLNETNCITYSNYKDLTQKINGLTHDRYKEMQLATLQWAKRNTTVERAKQLLKEMSLL